jgi:hypothetical protein
MLSSYSWRWQKEEVVVEEAEVVVVEEAEAEEEAEAAAEDGGSCNRSIAPKMGQNEESLHFELYFGSVCENRGAWP